MFAKLGEEGTEFNAHMRWLDKWKTRYGICYFDICGEKLSGGSVTVDIYKTEFDGFMEGYTKDQILNTAETRLNFKYCHRKLSYQKKNTLILDSKWINRE